MAAWVLNLRNSCAMQKVGSNIFLKPNYYKYNKFSFRTKQFK